VTIRTATHQALLAARLEAVMRRQGLSVRQLALRAGLPLSVVQKLIAGEGRQTSIWTLVQLADTLAVSLDYLVGRTRRDVDTEPPQRATRSQDHKATAPQPKRQRSRKAMSVASEDGTMVSSVRCQRPAGVSGPAAVAEAFREPIGTPVPPAPPSETSLDLHPLGHTSAGHIPGPLHPTPRHEPSRP
jgi:hypothetical protein